ncbi:Tricarboxylate transport protein TctB [Leucobacter sp. 7(1)]|uniref:tripartite tricarboxylate transporter TctB family protein n=1 Tax=Leucobacter sp. 7(1) TaxID=1255613 RepID=UPI00097F3A33|nr:tripartite tricarboxylate transporter TctB family protein [Leucobacter sp. 7(1)]SJN08847.1 Tricarboxylate transport protein TctB [Leucobacter sp. 7(1)]
MTPSNNPTAMSAVVGEEILLESGRGRTAELLKDLIMPVLLAAFAAYLVVGMVTMRVPEGTAFPGPRFFPGLIAAGLLIFAMLLGIAAVRAALRSDRSSTRTVGTGDDAFELLAAEHEAAHAAVDPAADGTPVPGKAVGVDWRSLAWVVLPFLAFAFLLPVLGWIIAAALLFASVARAFGLRKPLMSLVVGLTMSSVIYIAFDIVLGMSLPSGVLGWGF